MVNYLWGLNTTYSLLNYVCLTKVRRKIMSNFEIKDNNIILKGATAGGEAVFIELNMDEIIQARNEYIKNNKEYVKKAIADVFKILLT